ncbi:STM4504/CBY_0614 family protein [Agrobacterium sp. CG674]
MPIVDIFSKRQRRARGDVIDTYQYETMSNALRTTLFFAIQDGMGDYGRFRMNTSAGNTYAGIVKILRREYGVTQLVPYVSNEFEEIQDFFVNRAEIDEALDVLELCCVTIDKNVRSNNYLTKGSGNAFFDGVLSEINHRLKEAGVGYQYTNGEIIRVDSELIHAEVVKPALRLLNGPEYAGPQDEYLSAHQHYRHGNNKEALVDCLKAFESTMKAICDKRGWQRDSNATASQLIKLLFEKELVPVFWQTQMNALKSSLESAVPTGRNKLAGHGQGSEPVSVPNYLASYMLHMTASTILFLVEAEIALV